MVAITGASQMVLAETEVSTPATQTTEAAQVGQPEQSVQQPTSNVTVLQTIQLSAQPEQYVDPDISAVPKTIISREEMLKYGDQSVNDALRRAAGIQMGGPGQGPRGGNGPMRFRGGGAPVFLINGEPIQGGPRSGTSVIDTITTEMIERIEIVKQPSVAQASVASSAVINIILKQPLEHTLVNGSVRLGYGLTESDQKQEERKNLSLQMDGRKDAWLYSLSANQMWNDSTNQTTTQSQSGSRTQKRVTERSNFMLSPRLEYEIDDQQKLVADIFYREGSSKGQTTNRFQDDENESIRLNTRYERKEDGNSDKIRLSMEKQDETERTRVGSQNTIIDESVEEYALAYDGVRKFADKKQIKFGFDARSNELESNIVKTLDEQNYALYLEGSMRLDDRQTLTIGARQQFLERSGLVDYSDQHLSPVVAHRYDFDEHWSLQTNLSKAFRSPRAQQVMPTVSISNDVDAGSLNNPDRGGNASLKAEKTFAAETTLGYNSPAGGVNVTAYHRKVDDYIERVIREENGRFVERPSNQDNATTYGVEVSGRYALEETGNGHSFMLNGQVSTVRAKVEQENGTERLASDVAPYTASVGASYNYKPWRLSSSINVNYTPEFTRTLDNQPYTRSTNQRVNVDISATKRFDHNWSGTFSARNIFSTDYKERLNALSDGSLYEARVNQTIPSFMLSVEKKF